ncbi:MAG: ABC-F family ATP-binding cassette domain-containing protein [Candidatus Dormibacteraeota bacterium]|nr:ABC-F family ATP-binding cassette domain-containing protein [Candidatus Dormibacteraeota bacterium]
MAATHLSLFTPGKELLQDADFAILPSQRTALVGRNGSGKSSLLTAILAGAAGEPPPEHLGVRGTLTVPPGVRVAALPQSPQLAFDGTAAAYLDACAGEAGRAWTSYQRIAARLEAEGAGEDLLASYGDALEAVEAVGAWDHEARRAEVLDGVGLAAGEFAGRPLAALSGGQATRLALAGVLIAPADLLLLDEPSNNLDLAGVRFLSDWLRRSPAALLMVSHDRDLLDAVAEEVMEIEEWTRRLRLYGGNYTFYAERKREQFDAQLRQYLDQERRRERLEASARRIAQRAEGFQARSQNDFYRGKSSKVARTAKAQEARVGRELSGAEQPLLPARPRLTVLPCGITSGRLLSARGLDVRYGDAGVLSGLSLDLQAGQRVALVGPNGSGKSTLLRALAGRLSPAAGSIDRAPRLRLGYLDQVPERGDPDRSLLTFASGEVELPEEELRRLLGKVLFDDAARVQVREASLGELRRVACAAILAGAPDLLLLDEPTNHLDLPSIEMLEEALDEYQGAVLAVSHDRRFLRRLRPSQRLRVTAGRLVPE